MITEIAELERKIQSQKEMIESVKRINPRSDLSFDYYQLSVMEDRLIELKKQQSLDELVSSLREDKESC